MQPVPTEAFHWPRLLSKVLNMQNNKLESTHIITETILHSSLPMCMQRPFTQHPHYTEPHSSLPKSRRETTNPANHVCDWDSADWCLNPHTHTAQKHSPCRWAQPALKFTAAKSPASQIEEHKENSMSSHGLW